ncbi:MAG: S9 family peptidase [Gemmatimonadaceae bacterium]|nr:S9 family peptidase [Gemmatimonadaceae bacterium]
MLSVRSGSVGTVPPRVRPALFLLVATLATWLIASAPLQAQGAAAAPRLALKELDPADLAFWKTIRNAVTSNDGKWFAYVLAPNEGDAEVVIRPTADGGKEWRFPIGEPPLQQGFGGGGDAPLLLSGDAKWALFMTYPKAADARKLRKERKPLQNGAVLVNLSTGEKRDVEKVRRAVFAGERPNYAVLHRYNAEGTNAAEMILVDLRSGALSTVGAVGEFAVDDAGAWLAWTVETRDLVGNGVQLRNLSTDVVHTLDSEKQLYRRLAWSDSGFALSVLRGRPDSAASDTVYSVLGWSNASLPAPARTTYSAAADSSGFPLGMRISPDRAPRWASDRSAIFFGIAARRAGPDSKTPRPDVRPVAGTPGAMQSPAGVGGTDDDLPTLVIWHGKGDPRLQSQQQVEEQRDKTYSYLAEYRLAEKKFIRLADDELRDVALAPRERYAVGNDRRAYERRDNIDGGQRRDLYVIDLATGARTLAVKSVRYAWQPSPDGTKALFYDDGNYHVYDFASKMVRNVTQGAPTSFIDSEDDHNVDRPPVQPLGWASDNQHVLLFDNWDVWKVPVKGGALVNLTGNGKKDRIRYTRRLVFNPKERGIDLTRPVYLQTYGEWTKKEGLAVVQPLKAGAQSLLWDDAKYFVSRARDAETWIFTRQTVQQFPDYWVSDKTLASPRRLTDANPQQKDYAWSSGARLVDYVSDKGDTLQGALYLPANYEPGKKYPTVVYIYEKLSQGLHQYAVPNETRAFNPSIYTSRGYAVLQPDIVYKINDPGMSSVWCVVPAVKAAIATGIVDPANVGLHGHSWGGYQSSFLATQTGTLFKSIVTGAPLTDMVSMYASVYWNTGTADMAIFENSQGRFKGSVQENMEAYLRNSPAFHADQVQTKLMILHNEKDGAVDFNQGITWFNHLRELDKDVIMLQYVGENHGLQLPKNQKDYTIRMREYFDHYLKGAPAPDWMVNGVPRLKMEEHLKSRQKKEKIAS